MRCSNAQIAKIIAGFALFAVVCTPASAASFAATALSTVSDPTISAGATYMVFDTPPPDGFSTMTTTTGTGSATAGGFNDVGFGSQFGDVFGSATFPPVSSSFAGFEAHELVEVDNSMGVGPAVLEFTFDYSAALSAIAPLPTEIAGAGYNFHITGADDEAGELLEVDTGDGAGFVAVSDFEVDDFIVASAGDATATVGGSVKIKYTGAAPGAGGDGIYAFSIFTRVDGGAEAVPEPGSILSLMGLGLCAACWPRRRRR